MIFGLNQDSLDFAKKLEKEGTVIYFDKSSSDLSDKLKSVKTKSVIIGEVDDTVLKKYHITDERTKISAYALSDDYEANIKFAESLKGLKGKGHLTLMGDEEDYLKHPNFDDFAGIYVTNPLVLSARQLIQQSPPYQIMEFDNGQANNDFHLLQIGFGHIGQEVLKQVYMNAQFVGSQFRADIFAPDIKTNTGRIRATTTIMDDKEIKLHSYKCESSEFYQFVEKKKSSVNYIVIATGDSERNREFARHLRQIFGIDAIHIVQTDGVYKGSEFYSNFDKELLDSAKLDKKAKLLNYNYSPEEDHDEEQQWLATSYFNRMSSRASADFSNALIKASGIFDIKENQLVFSKDWLAQVQKDEILYENLGRMEHLRWNAFHRAMNFTELADDKVRQRAKQSKENDPKKFIKDITRDYVGRQHICLVNWEDLPSKDELVAELYEKRFGHKYTEKTYQQIDKDFVEMVPALQEN